jgi:hypothetical protein
MAKMLRTPTIIVITTIMVEVLKISLLLWWVRAAARIAMTRMLCRAHVALPD